ncbi:MAG: T9SS type A sorting domain-containing protein, partial [Bacteroidia bacterium]|nr:T9SS type A sorting domain-containing protein [Bacteroidia bacterium]
ESELTITSSQSNFDENSQLKIYDLAGKTVFSSGYFKGNCKINAGTNLTPGLYVLEICNKFHSSKMKIVKL